MVQLVLSRFVHENSVAAYHEFRRKFSAKQMILELFQRGGEFSRNDVARLTGFRINVVCGRINELIKEGRLQRAGNKVDTITGSRVELLRIR